MKIDRLIGILMMLINKKKVTASQLSEYFEVSVRTIQRDMDILNMAGIPLYADVGVKGGYQLQENYRLEKGFLNKDEAGILYSFLKALDGVTPYSEVSSIYNKFAGIDSHNLENNKLVVRLNSAFDSSRFKDNLSLLSEARDKLRKVKMIYYDVNFNITTRIICPYSLVLLSSTWYFYAYCQMRSGFRMFKLSRIADCELLDESFQLKELPDIMPWDTIDKDDRKKDEIVLEIDRFQPNILPDYLDPSKCEVAGDKIIARLNFVIDEWLYSQLFSLIPHVRILEPESLRKGFNEWLKKAIKMNSPE